MHVSAPQGQALRALRGLDRTGGPGKTSVSATGVVVVPVERATSVARDNPACHAASAARSGFAGVGGAFTWLPAARCGGVAPALARPATPRRHATPTRRQSSPRRPEQCMTPQAIGRPRRGLPPLEEHRRRAEPIRVLRREPLIGRKRSNHFGTQPTELAGRRTDDSLHRRLEPLGEVVSVLTKNRTLFLERPRHILRQVRRGTPTSPRRPSPTGTSPSSLIDTCP